MRFVQVHIPHLTYELICDERIPFAMDNLECDSKQRGTPSLLKNQCVDCICGLHVLHVR